MSGYKFTSKCSCGRIQTGKSPEKIEIDSIWWGEKCECGREWTAIKECVKVE